jgi:hypothetical protein
MKRLLLVVCAFGLLLSSAFAQDKSPEQLFVMAGAALPWGGKIFRAHRLARNGFNEQIFGADEQVPKVAAGVVQKMHSVSN